MLKTWVAGQRSVFPLTKYAAMRKSFWRVENLGHVADYEVQDFSRYSQPSGIRTQATVMLAGELALGCEARSRLWCTSKFA